MTRLDALTALAKVGSFRAPDTAPDGTITVTFERVSLGFYETLNIVLSGTGYRVLSFERKGAYYVCKIAPVKVVTP